MTPLLNELRTRIEGLAEERDQLTARLAEIDDLEAWYRNQERTVQNGPPDQKVPEAPPAPAPMHGPVPAPTLHDLPPKIIALISDEELTHDERIAILAQAGDGTVRLRQAADLLLSLRVSDSKKENLVGLLKKRTKASDDWEPAGRGVMRYIGERRVADLIGN